jgi:hypothetical protein
MGVPYLEEQLHTATIYYYTLKSHHLDIRGMALDELAEAVVLQNNIPKATAIHSLKERRDQRRVARKIKYLWGKLSLGSTWMVTIQSPSRTTEDLVDKIAVEKAIMIENQSKYRQAFHTPFLKPPLIVDFGLLGIGKCAHSLLRGR